ncbi:Hypothetical_protein [Hexamita inflata]|uniref:Hypothetical_protein n=1 Tax=Hexamita inflata TaxID=28002 RepID=A0AA86PWG2_9EUKA|nr:Hypothetical protein HINF_LOCUS26084 [Hexamita inflata]CAI9947655.1 Hypothetical protein HINF_LOCUS35300 [Hexamita inflata]
MLNQQIIDQIVSSFQLQPAIQTQAPLMLQKFQKMINFEANKQCSVALQTLSYYNSVMCEFIVPSEHIQPIFEYKPVFDLNLFKHNKEFVMTRMALLFQDETGRGLQFSGVFYQ